ncbi:PDR/VanB family oxidoreductase [Rhodococcus sp. USK10]|uniref:PDR/VanB family oxidoreductase n=1 Tax=Rhodococcus sp. USK10 TaxID=2789739 RepID=UPI0021519460|nr:PDR/VanB family oxidoreductase [Rhodococcus sp. USK10]
MSELLTIEARVRDISDIARGVKSLELEAADGRVLPATLAGQYIDVSLTPGVTRSYSLLDPSSVNPKVYRIAVALSADSRGGSRAVHQSIREGDLLTISPPSGGFVPNEDAPHSVFIAGGIGITPIYAMIAQLTASGRSWELHYASPSRERAAFLAEILEQKPSNLSSVTLYISDESGPRSMRVANIVEVSKPGAHLYCCGPSPLIDDFLAATRHRPADTVHLERFTNDTDPAKGGFTVELAQSGMTLEIEENESILDAVLDAGIMIDFSCEEGICGSCRTRVLEGTPDHRDSILTTTEREAGDTMFICCSGSKGERLVLDL